MKHNLYLLLFSFFGITTLLNAQTKNIAYLRPAINRGPVSMDILTELNKNLTNKSASPVYFYLLDNTGNIRYSEDPNTNKPEKAAKYLVRYDFDIYEIYFPEIQFTKDTNGNYIDAYVQLNKYSKVQYKATDLSNSEIVFNFYKTVTLEDNSFNKIKSKISIPDWKKQFTANPVNYKQKFPSEYMKAENWAYNQLRPEFTKFYQAKKDLIIFEFLQAQLKLQNKELCPVTNPIIEKNKLINFTVKSDEKLPFYRAAYASIYQLDTLGDFIYGTDLGLYVGNTEEDGSVKFTKAPFKSNSEEVAQSLLNGKKLYYAIGEQGYGNKLNKKSEFINVGVNSGSSEVNNSIEFYFKNINNIRLINLNDEPIIKAFRDRYKGEAFMEEPLEIKDLGADYIMSVNANEQLEVTDVKTGKISMSKPIDETRGTIYNSLLDAFNLNIDVIKISKEKKERALELLLYSPLGFNDVTKMDVFVAKAENVGGRQIERLEKIGELRASLNGNFSDNKGRVDFSDVRDGDKEIFQALKDGKKIVIRCSEKKGITDKLNKLNSKLEKLNKK